MGCQSIRLRKHSLNRCGITPLLPTSKYFKQNMQHQRPCYYTTIAKKW
jgi:hypothetical protein